MTDNKHISENEEKAPLQKSYSILQINLGLFAFYSLAFPLIGGADGLFASSMAAYGHGAILLLVGFAFLFNDKKRGTGAAMILSALVLAVIGFSFCVGGIEANGGLNIH